ncbi:hypothetical protein AVEN_112407-1 [Araneus ventricosus]|uniref:Uncharacterized protein n=1 Tax=Araneus ventricosus TaxID=182803 RepID=A0A4Y2P940_ARAVE|nr:hypothetical protein AVEN_112407-1 [Araneus ventricosus]
MRLRRSCSNGGEAACNFFLRYPHSIKGPFEVVSAGKITFLLSSTFCHATMLEIENKQMCVWGQSVQGSKPDSSEDPPCMWACCKLNHW